MAKVSLVVLLVHLTAAFEPAPVWRTDSQTGKQYAFITYNGSRTMDYETGSALCGTISAFLAEPRNQHENQFIYQMIGDKSIYLGMKDSELSGQWVWQSDRTNVSWANWQSWPETTHFPGPEPNGRNSNESCAIMISESYRSQGIPYNRSTWADIGCDRSIIDVVCEKETSCPYKVLQCFTDNGVPNVFAPKVTHMCAVRNEIERCIDCVECSSSHQQAWQSQYRKAIIEEMCSISTVNWTAWETTTTRTCMNDNDLEIDTEKQFWKCIKQHPTCPCQGVTDICSAYNARYECYVNEMSEVCAGGSPYKNHMKEIWRAILKALIATFHRVLTEAPHNCTLTVP